MVELHTLCKLPVVCQWALWQEFIINAELMDKQIYKWDEEHRKATCKDILENVCISSIAAYTDIVINGDIDKAHDFILYVKEDNALYTGYSPFLMANAVYNTEFKMFCKWFTSWFLDQVNEEAEK